MASRPSWWKEARATVAASAIGLRERAVRGLARARALRRAATGLVFPPVCVSCDTELTGVQASLCGFCRECYDELDLFRGPTCPRCCGPLPEVEGVAVVGTENAKKSAGCFRCSGHKLWFHSTLAAGLYEGLLRDLLLGMKRAEGDWLSLAMGQLVWQQCGEKLRALEADVVAPIPLHWRRRLEHRTNSAAVLAESVSDQLRVPLAEGLFKRQVHTPRQSELTPPQRWKNVRGAFAVRGGYHLRDAHVLLVDDILTTGATCSEAARTLRNAGASRVTVVVVARAIG